MVRYVIGVVVACFLGFLMMSCSFLFGPSPEQLRMQQELAMKLLSANSRDSFNTYSQKKEPQTPAMTENELSEKVKRVTGLDHGVEFIRKQDGFSYNGKRFMDPEGTIKAFSYNSQTGDVTYFASPAPNEVIIKWCRVMTNVPPLAIANAKYQNGQWHVRTVTGATMVGDSLSSFSNGFLVGRKGTGFLYVPGQGIKQIACPDGFQIAKYQNGDVSETNYILAERVEEEDDSQIDELITKTQALGATLGINKKEDYILLNVDTGKQVLINVELEGKGVAVYSGFKGTRANGLINEYSEVNFYESLYEKSGSPNSGHYFWRISWFDSQEGPILIVRESGSPKITVHNLITDKKVTAFERFLGINWMTANKKADGKIELTAKLGLSTETIDDVIQMMASTNSNELTQ